MTSRERWLALFEGRTPDRIPTDIWHTGEVRRRLVDEVGPDFVEKLEIDSPASPGPRPLRHEHPDIPGADIWGRKHRRVDYGAGEYNECVSNPLAAFDSVQQVHDYRWPSPDDMDYTTVADGVAAHDGRRVLRCGGFEPFLLYCHLRGMEQSYEDLLLNPEIAHAILGHIFDYFHEVNRRSFEAAGKGGIDLFYLAEDLGAQTGPLFSLAVYREFLMPNQKKMADLAKSYGARVFYHTDGAARPFLPDLIETVGIDLLNPLQWNCPGMELEGLVADFGEAIVFHGGIDNQHTLPFGAEDDVREQVRYVAGVMKDARWVCAPCHNIQPNTPTANILAMYDEIKRVPV